MLKLRSMSAMLMPVAAKADITKHAALLYCRRFIKDFFADSCSGLPPYGYRIEIKGENVDRAAISKAMAAVIDSDEVVNSPSDYEIELIAKFGKRTRIQRTYTQGLRFLPISALNTGWAPCPQAYIPPPRRPC